MSLEIGAPLVCCWNRWTFCFFAKASPLPFSAGSAESRLPTPKTLAGALKNSAHGTRRFTGGRVRETWKEHVQRPELRTIAPLLLARESESLPFRFAGPWLCKTDGNGTNIDRCLHSRDSYAPQGEKLHKESKSTESRFLRLDTVVQEPRVAGWRTPPEDFRIFVRFGRVEGR